MVGTITVVNKRHIHSITPNDFYIGRPSVLGNPIKLSPNEPKGSTLPRFEAYLADQIARKNQAILAELNRISEHVRQGADVRLICWCAPDPCHGDITKKVLLRDFICSAIEPPARISPIPVSRSQLQRAFSNP